MKKFTWIIVSTLLLSACETTSRHLDIPLTDFNRNVIVKKNEHLTIQIANQLPANSGGDTGYYQVDFKQVHLWLERKLNYLNNPGCDLNKNIVLNVAVTKLHNNVDSEYATCTIVLNGKFSSQGKEIISRKYRGDSVSNYFSGTYMSAIQGCFNVAMDRLLPKMQMDLCQIATHQAPIIVE